MSETFSREGRKLTQTNVNIVKYYCNIRNVSLPEMESMTIRYFRMQKGVMVCSNLKLSRVMPSVYWSLSDAVISTCMYLYIKNELFPFTDRKRKYKCVFWNAHEMVFAIKYWLNWTFQYHCMVLILRDFNL